MCKKSFKSNKLKVWGVPVVSSLLLLETYTTDEASAVNGTYSNALMLNRNAAIIGDRRIFTIKVSDEVLVRTDQLLIVASERFRNLNLKKYDIIYMGLSLN